MGVAFNHRVEPLDIDHVALVVCSYKSCYRARQMDPIRDEGRKRARQMDPIRDVTAVCFSCPSYRARQRDPLNERVDNGAQQTR